MTEVHWNTQIYKTNNNRHKDEVERNTITVEDF